MIEAVHQPDGASAESAAMPSGLRAKVRRPVLYLLLRALPGGDRAEPSRTPGGAGPDLREECCSERGTARATRRRFVLDGAADRSTCRRPLRELSGRRRVALRTPTGSAHV